MVESWGFLHIPAKRFNPNYGDRSAHNLLQLRTKVLNDQLRETFVR